MGDLDSLYREVILDHFKNPRNHGKVADPDVKIEGVNPLCGDQIELSFRLKDGKLDDIQVEGKGCSISQSSASMMTEALKGKTLEECSGLVKGFKRLMLENGTADELPEDLADLASLEGVKKFPARIKCAVLSWNTFLEGLETYSQRKAKVVAKHEER